MVQPEDRIEPSGVRIGHQSGKFDLGVAATDQAVNPIVRLRLDAPMDLAAVTEPRVDAAEAGAAAARDPVKSGSPSAFRLIMVDRHVDVAVVVRTISLWNIERIVALSVRPVR